MANKQVGAGTGGRDPELLPTPSLTPDHFEDFTEALLHRQRFVAGPARRLVGVSRWGRRGDKQDGIDFVGAYDDGKTVTWQCKRIDELTPTDVKKYIKENAYTADEHVLVFSGLAKPKARAEVLKVQGGHYSTSATWDNSSTTCRCTAPGPCSSSSGTRRCAGLSFPSQV